MIIDISDVVAVGYLFDPETRILLDGRDISDVCYRAVAADPEDGVAYCWIKQDGAHVFSGGAPSAELRHGKVQIIRPSKIKAHGA